MIEFTISNTEYKISDLTIRDYYRIQHMFVMEGTSARMNIISELSNCSHNELRKLDKLQFNTLWNSLVDTHLSIDGSQPFHKSFVFKDVAYCFLDIDNLTIGEFADMEVLKADPNHNRNLHKMMAVLYRPAIVVKGKQYAEPYDSISLNDRAEAFMDLPMLYVQSALNFFLQVPKLCLETTLNSLIKDPTITKEEREILKEMSTITLELLEAGTEPSSTSLEKISQKLERLKELNWLLSSTSSPSKKTELKSKKSWLGKLVYEIKSEANKIVEKKRNNK